MFAVPHDLVRGGLVQAETERRLVLPHLTCHVVATAQLVREALAKGVKDDTANTTKGLSCQELDLGIGIIRLHQASWVHLNPLKIDAVCTNCISHLDGISGAVLAVCGWQV